MKPTSSRSNLIRKLLSFFAKDRRIRKLRADLERDIDSATNRLRAWKPSYQYLKAESDRLRKQLYSLRHELDHPQRRKARGEFESITAADQRIAVLEHRLSALISQETDWLQRTETVSQKATELWKRSALIPGDNFAKQADQKKRDIDAALRGISAFTDHKKIKERIEQASSRLDVFSSEVCQAEEVMDGLPKLSDEISSMDQMGIQHDVSCFQKYQSLVRLVEQIKSETNSNRYTAGHHLLKNAQAAASSLRHDLKTREALARVEIGLWLTDEGIARRFSLKDFPEHLSPKDEQRWRDLRVEIARLVDERASATRSQYARMSGGKRNLRFSFKQLGEPRNLEAFARSAQNQSSYP